MAIKRLIWGDKSPPLLPPTPGFSLKDLGILPLLPPAVSLRQAPETWPQQHPLNSSPTSRHQ